MLNGYNNSIDITDQTRGLPVEYFACFLLIVAYIILPANRLFEKLQHTVIEAQSLQVHFKKITL
jgi:hypothetical protein